MFKSRTVEHVVSFVGPMGCGSVDVSTIVGSEAEVADVAGGDASGLVATGCASVAVDEF